MARRIKVKDLKREITRTFKNKLQTEINKTSFKKQIVKESIDMIYKRVKTGYGVKSDSDPNTVKKRLRKLSPLYKKYRKEYKKKAKFGDFGTVAKSNLTLSGQMLNAFGWTLRLNGFKIFIKKSRRKQVKDFFNYISAEAASTAPKRVLNNAQVAEYVSKTRPFLILAKSEQRIIKKYYEKLVRSLARRF